MMNKTKRTPWFEGVNPKYNGCYEILINSTPNYVWTAYFIDGKWYAETVINILSLLLNQSPKWRGLK